MSRKVSSWCLLCVTAAIPVAARAQDHNHQTTIYKESGGERGSDTVSPLSNSTQAGMTREEAVVRTAYAKLAYASQQAVIWRLALEALGSPGLPKSTLSNQDRFAAAEVNFQLSDFTVGNLADIVERRTTDLISPPTGEVLSVRVVVKGFGEGPIESERGRVNDGTNQVVYTAEPRWTPAAAIPLDVEGLTFGDLQRREWKSEAPTTTWQRYASYTVTVSFQGQAHGPYRALFVFGHDAKGRTMVVPKDDITDSMALADLMSMHLFPGPFVVSRMRTYPVVIDWLDAHQGHDPACSRGQNDVCCDLTLLQCGPGSADVRDGLSRPLPPGAIPYKPN